MSVIIATVGDTVLPGWGVSLTRGASSQELGNSFSQRLLSGAEWRQALSPGEAVPEDSQTRRWPRNALCAAH